ncbi:spore coat associated protein CotJA [Sporosalibacterium faouarense]|uniref:spore coat associated protein CotJA n=1 Tax=Sporosalibacterium faouarense TaxID=516123 RepID=UPI00192AF1FE|nr:spore coat associated protein CotJA [Sporosalibacterium faouarense]
MDNNMHNGNMPLSPYSKPGVELAEGYFPFQVMGKVFKPKEALCKGTLFPELYKPYKVGK